MGWKMIQIPSEKVYTLSEHIEKALRHAGKAMQCLEDMMPEHGMGERYMDERYMGERGNYGQGGSSYSSRSYGSYGNRDDEWHEREMDERRRRDSRGRYM